MRVNDVQHGGDHYKKCDFQPWDWDRYGVGSLECNVIKYVTRYKDKSGLLDLQKAQHYLQKLIAEHEYWGRCNRVPAPKALHAPVVEYFNQWKPGDIERAVIVMALTWTNKTQLHNAIGYVQELIDGYSTSDVRTAEPVDQTTTAVGVVPLE